MSGVIFYKAFLWSFGFYVVNDLNSPFVFFSFIVYSQVFREQCIDGSALPLLTEDHLTNSMGMKLGPALKFRSVLAKKIGQCPVCVHCIHCHLTGSDKKD
jgi:hypothetical protein